MVLQWHPIFEAPVCPRKLIDLLYCDVTLGDPMAQWATLNGTQFMNQSNSERKFRDSYLIWGMTDWFARKGCSKHHFLMVNNGLLFQKVMT